MVTRLQGDHRSGRHGVLGNNGLHAGTWTIEVVATEVNVDAYVETPATDADYALVVTG